MTNFKPGDLVMATKLTPCCRRIPLSYGRTFIVKEVFPASACCAHCHLRFDMTVVNGIDGQNDCSEVLIKIDPPAEGDSLPTRRDLEMPA